MSTNPFEILDDYAHKVVEEHEATTRVAFETRHRSYTKEIPFLRVFQDDGSKTIYRDKQGYCYATSSLGGLRFPFSLNLTHEEPLDGVTRIIDPWGNE